MFSSRLIPILPSVLVSETKIVSAGNTELTEYTACKAACKLLDSFLDTMFSRMPPVPAFQLSGRPTFTEHNCRSANVLPIPASGVTQQ